MFGKDGLDIDKYFRALQLGTTIDSEYEALSPANRSFLSAYADGINAYVSNARLLPIEFTLMDIDFAPWKVKDSLLIFKLLSFVMSAHWQLTTVRSGIADRLGRELAERMIPFRSEDIFLDEVTIIKEEKASKTEKRERRETTAESKGKPAAGSFKELPKHIKSSSVIKGSNAWAVHGNYTASGKPLLANDPHLGHQIPSEMYLVALKYPQGPTLTGATEVGVPLVVIGRNERVAWGITMSLIENVDLYSIRLDDTKTHYYYNNSWRSLTTKEETIRVKDGSPVRYVASSTHHGPILDYPLKPDMGAVLAYCVRVSGA